MINMVRSLMSISTMHAPKCRPHIPGFVCTLFVVMMTAFITGCHTQEVTIGEDSPLASGDTLVSERYGSDSSRVVDSSAMASVTVKSNSPVGLTVGERLKQLDSLMLVVPADSLGFLMNEYERILDSALFAQNPEPPTPSSNATGRGVDLAQADTSRNESVVNPAASSPIEQSNNQAPSNVNDMTTPTTNLVDSSLPSERSESTALVETSDNLDGYVIPQGRVKSVPRSSLKNKPDSRTLVSSDIRDSAQRHTSLDPADYKGVRQSELAGAASSGTSARSSSTGKGQKGAASSTRSNSSGRSQKSAATKESVTEQKSRGTADQSTSTPSGSHGTSGSGNGPSIEARYTQGLAYFRAGSYQKASEELSHVVRSKAKRFIQPARYYYALSLERTGHLKDARSQYSRLKNSGGTFGDKSYLAYCRILAAQGNRTQARKDLLSFIKNRSNSSQIGQARVLLQTL